MTNDKLGSATYSPEDNKIRFYPDARLSKDDYDRARATGFIWAPKQGLFVAPMWTPEREDLMIEWCGEVGDEDKSLMDRAAERSDRFQDYSASRKEDAERARENVAAIADNIPLGQPILVGHHSERRARKDAERIENGMRRAVKMWETSQYWKERAASAISHAKYKERPDVRARRIKGIEADKRKRERSKQDAQNYLDLWLGCNDLTRAQLIAGQTQAGWLPTAKHPTLDQYLHPSDVLPFPDRRDYAKDNYPTWTLDQVKERAQSVYSATMARCDRWISHYENQLAYERAMLESEGGLTGEKFNIVIGGRVCLNRRGGEWYIVHKVNRKDGAIFSVSVFGYFRTIKIEEISDYQAPKDGDWEKVRAASKTPPLCNYPGEGFLHQTKAEFEATQPKWSDFAKTKLIKADAKFAAHRVRNTREPGKEYWHTVGVYLTDAKRTDPPTAESVNPVAVVKEMRDEARAQNHWAQPIAPKPRTEPEQTDFDAMKESLKAGVQVVSADQLFPTPPEVARRMVELAEIQPGNRVLEPSAGTGNILKAVADEFALNDALGVKGSNLPVVAVELNINLAHALAERWKFMDIRRTDFLECNGDLGKFDRILMNPPFKNGEDIKHIEHALTMLATGGRLVAICANGPRQQEKLQPLADNWEELPEGTFNGTNVRAALLTITK